MAKKYLIGVDLGTSATKAALYYQDGSLISENTTEVPIYYPEPALLNRKMKTFIKRLPKR